MEQNEFRDALIDMLNEIEEEGALITEEELERRINDLANAFGVPVPTIPKKIKKQHICVQCGAPLHGGRCEYCGTEY